MTDGCLKRLAALNKPYKYVCHFTLGQRVGARDGCVHAQRAQLEGFLQARLLCLPHDNNHWVSAPRPEQFCTCKRGPGSHVNAGEPWQARASAQDAL